MSSDAASVEIGDSFKFRNGDLGEVVDGDGDCNGDWDMS